MSMASIDNAENPTPMHELKTDHKNVAKPESQLSDETEQDPENTRGPIPRDESGDAAKLNATGPPDGGTAAWLVVLGAWCCSFSSPGWINSMCSLSLHKPFLRSHYVGSNGRCDGLTEILSHQVWVASNSIMRLDL